LSVLPDVSSPKSLNGFLLNLVCKSIAYWTLLGELNFDSCRSHITTILHEDQIVFYRFHQNRFIVHTIRIPSIKILNSIHGPSLPDK
jgi:hypothetical protein